MKQRYYFLTQAKKAFSSSNSRTNLIEPGQLMSTKMAHPPSLPEELITLILRNFDPKEDANTIHAARLVNSMFRRLATPLLHRRINVRMPTPGNSMKPEDAEKDLTFVQQLIENPEWALFVKDLTITQNHKNIASDEERAVWKAIIEADDEDVKVGVAEAVKDKRRHDARIAFFLINCKDLERIHSPLALNTLPTLVRRVLNDASSRHLNARFNHTTTPASTLLNSVKEISIGESAYENSIADVLTLLSLSSLHTLRIGNLADTCRFWDRSPPAFDGVVRNTNPLTLVFDMCMMSPPGLDTILQAAPSTKSLALRWRPGLWNDQFNTTAFYDLLRTNETARGLEKLCLDYTPMIEHRYGMQALESFGSFDRLGVKWLAVPKAFFDHLFDLPVEQRVENAVSLLPKGLRELSVLGIEEEERVEMEKVVGLVVLREAGLGQLERSLLVPWFHFSLYEHFGEVRHRNVDYEAVEGYGFEIERMK